MNTEEIYILAREAMKAMCTVVSQNCLGEVRLSGFEQYNLPRALDTLDAAVNKSVA